MKVVINNCHGGFSLSKEGMERYCEIKGIECWIEEDTQFKSMGLYTCWLVPKEERVASSIDWHAMSMDERAEHNRKHSEQTIYCRDIERDDPALVQLVEENSGAYSGRCAQLAVVEIPDDVKWTIEEYDGNEWVAEVHRTWS